MIETRVYFGGRHAYLRRVTLVSLSSHRDTSSAVFHTVALNIGKVILPQLVLYYTNDMVIPMLTETVNIFLYARIGPILNT